MHVQIIVATLWNKNWGISKIEYIFPLTATATADTSLPLTHKDKWQLRPSSSLPEVDPAEYIGFRSILETSTSLVSSGYENPSHLSILSEHY